MDTLPRQSPPDRAQLVERYERNRRRSQDLFGLVRDDAYYSRPIALRHPFAFYEGHLPAFSFLVLNERALREAPLDAHYEKLFERGIDPGTITDAQKLARSDWPTKEEIVAFGRRCDERVVDALLHATLEDSSVPRLHRAQSAYTILEHEEMHHETLAYIIHRLDPKFKRRVVQEHIDHRPPVNDLVAIDVGIATLGANRDDLPFGWDNEFCAHEAAVAPFGIQRYPVTNGEYLDFVRAGGPMPPFWLPDGSGFALLGAFETLPLPLSWPVYATHEQAQAYAE